MKKRLLSCLLAGILVCQSWSVEAAQLSAQAGQDGDSAWQEELSAVSAGDGAGNGIGFGAEADIDNGSMDGDDVTWTGMEVQGDCVLQDAEGLFQAGSFQIQARNQSEIAFFSDGEDVAWQEWDSYIYDQLKARKTLIDVQDFQLPKEQISAWYFGVINEHPDLYFVNGTLSYTIQGDIVGSLRPTYRDGQDDEAFGQAAQAALDAITEDMTDVQKAVALHDYLVLNCEYDYENYLNNSIPADSYSAYGALVNRMAVCNGYALAYKYLMQEAGIPCYMVSSTAMNHAWNLVELDGKLYQVDVTWDDPTWDTLGRVGHANMFVSDKTLEERQEHHDWAISSRGKVVELKADDTAYDEYFWTDVTSPLILWGGSYYYIDQDSKSIKTIPVTGSTTVGDAVEICGDIGTWPVWGNTASYWRGAFSGLFMLGDRLYFNTPAQICSIKLDGTDRRTEFEADTTNGYLYGCAYSQEEALYILRTTPNSEGRDEILKAVLSGPIGISQVVLSRSELDLFSGAQAQLEAEVRPANATNKTVTWSSSDEQVATVSGQGLVTAVSAGSCVITALAGGRSATCTVTVTDQDISLGKLQTPVFSPEGGEVEKGTEIVLTAAEGAVIYYTTDGTVPDMGSNKYTRPLIVTQDMTVKAFAVQEHYENSDVAQASYQVKVIKSYKVAFDLQGHGQQLAPVTVEEGTRLAAREAPAAEGYIFGGWYKEAGCVNKWDFDIDTVQADMTLYAKWDKAGITVNNVGRDDTYAERIDLNSVDCAITAIKSKVYSGSPYTPTVKVTIQSVTGKNKRLTLTEGIDYRVSYENCTDAGTAVAVVEGNGNYKGTVRKEYVITPKSLRKLKVVTGGMAVKADPADIPVSIYDGNRLLTKGVDYEFPIDSSLTAQKNKAAKVAITGKGNYQGTINVKFPVYEAEVSQFITADSVTLSLTSTPYTGKAIRDDGLQVKVGGTELVKNKQFSVAYKNNINAGTAFVVVTGKGGYVGKVVKSFEIKAASSQALEIKSIPAKTYNGKLQMPSVTVKAGNKRLSRNKDYILTYKDNLHAGKAVVTVTGKGNYAGAAAEASFDIKAQKISKASVKGNREEGLVLTYNKRTLREGVDYSLSYDETSIRNNKIKVTVKGLGDFAGSTVTRNVKDAAEDLTAKVSPKSSSNKGQQNYVNASRWSAPMKSYLTANGDGTMMRVEYIGKKVWAENYQADGSCVSQKEIRMELPLFGGFYEGKDNYFLVFGQNNPKEDDNVEVIRVVKYDKSWNRQGAASLRGANTTVPFDAGSLRMTEYGGMLYVRTCHKMYTTSDGLNHQANLTFSVKVSQMQVTDQFSGIMNIAYGYVSHSFNQFIRVDGSKLVAVDHGDGAPRAVALVQYLSEAGGETFTKTQGLGGCCVSEKVFPIQGGYGANDTGVSVGGFEVSDSAYLVAGNSVPQDDADTYNAAGVRNIFVTGTRKDVFAADDTQAGDSSADTVIHWITCYTDKDSVKVSTPQLVKISNNEFLLLWAEGSQVKYVLLDGSGNPATAIHSMKGALSDCQPILTGDQVTWYYTDNSRPVFCRVNLADIRKS